MVPGVMGDGQVPNGAVVLMVPPECGTAGRGVQRHTAQPYVLAIGHSEASAKASSAYAEVLRHNTYQIEGQPYFSYFRDRKSVV